MTTTPQPSITTQPLAGSDVGPFATGWTYADPADVRAWIEDEGVPGAVLAQGIDYTLTASAPLTGGGTVMLSPALVPVGGWPTNARLVLRRRTTRRQAVALPDTEGHKPRATERALDKQMRIAEEDRDDLDRALLLPAGAGGGQVPWKPGDGVRFLTLDDDGRPRVVERPEDFDGLNKANRALEENASVSQLLPEAAPVPMGDLIRADIRPSHFVGVDYGDRANRAIQIVRDELGHGVIKLDAGRHVFTTPILNDNSAETGLTPLTHISIEGPGSACCELVWAGPDHQFAMTILGGAWGGGSDARIKLKGFTFTGTYPLPAAGRKGLKIERAGFVEIEDVYFKEWALAAHLTDVVGAKWKDVNVSFNHAGILGDGGQNPVLGSAPNEWIMSGCHLGTNYTFGCHLIGVTNLVVMNGSVEGNGKGVGAFASNGNNPAACGWWFEDGCYNGATAVTMIGTHHEFNVGACDIRIDHYQNPAVYNFIGIDLFRVDAATQVASHVLIHNEGLHPYVVNLGAAVGYNVYGNPPFVPSSPDQIVKRTGIPHPRDKVNAVAGYEQPDDMPRPFFDNEGYKAVSAAAIASAGTITTRTLTLRRRRNGRTALFEGELVVTNNGTGSGQIIVSAIGEVARQTGVVGMGRNNATGAVLQVVAVAGQQNLYVTTLDGGYPVGTGQTITFSATFEVQ